MLQSTSGNADLRLHPKGVHPALRGPCVHTVPFPRQEPWLWCKAPDVLPTPPPGSTLGLYKDPKKYLVPGY